VEGRGLERRAEVGFDGEVSDGVVNEDQVEAAPQAHGPHVAGDVLALRVEGPAHGQHGGRPVDERQGEVPLQVRGVVAAA
jgi:hypothetical protein